MNDHIWKQAYFLWLQLPALFTHRCNRKSHGHWLDFVLSHALVYKIQACTAELAYECFFFFPCWAVMAELTDVAIFLKHYNHPVAFNSSLPLFFPFLFFQKMCFCHHQHLSREKSMVTRKMTQQRRFCHYCYKTFRRMCTHYSSAVQDDIYFSFNLFKKVVLK